LARGNGLVQDRADSPAHPTKQARQSAISRMGTGKPSDFFTHAFPCVFFVQAKTAKICDKFKLAQQLLL
jgi:hypothetical protein